MTSRKEGKSAKAQTKGLDMELQRKIEIERFIAAAEQLLDRGTSLRPGGEPETLFAGGDPLSFEPLRALSGTAAKREMDVVYLEFDPQAATQGPRRLIISARREGAQFIFTDCVLWAPDDGGCLVFVTLNGGHFDFEHDELVPRSGFPAASLGEGMSRAAARLCALAATVPGGQGSLLSIAAIPVG